ncbi:MAG TPA: PQQ-binding-like beta-propeller repeat protein [Terriglobia bacterium]|nr:PQQ-binding-like beta-propeller repeat protein [Terriglobia bacterium]
MQKILLGILLMTGALMPPVARKFDTWKGYGGGADQSQYSSLSQINRNNVSQLQIAWTYQTGSGQTTNPLVVDGLMYVPRQGSVVALNAATGEEVWTSPGATSSRGMNFWQSADGKDRRLIIISGGQIKQINAATGETVSTIDTTANTDRRISAPSGNPGRVYKNLMIVTSRADGANFDSTPGDVQAFDLLTGERKWTFHSVPMPGEFGADTWPAEALTPPNQAGGVHNWSEFTVDEETGIVFVPFGTARYDFYGGNRKGNDLFANSLVALNANTGERIWHYQMIHHDLWDYDLPTAAKLLTIHKDGRDIDVVAQPTKHGFLFVLNRKTGEPIWPIEERPVPQSDVPGEYSSPTQPFPTKPKPFARQSFTEKDINPFISDQCKELIKQFLASSRNEGLFTPPSMKGSIELPGHNGGANWGSSAVDPTRGRLYVFSKELPTYLKISAPDGGNGRGGSAPSCGEAGGGRGAEGAAGAGRGGAGGRGAGAGGRGAGTGGGRGAGGGAATGAGGGARAWRPEGFVEYAASYDFMQTASSEDGVRSMSIIGPPWSQLTAYDLNTGEILWQRPNGGVAALGEAGKEIGAIAPRGGIVVTAGGLVFTGTSSDRKLHAYDQDTGKLIWETVLPAAPEGVPAVYQVNGKEYIAVPTGGGTVFQVSGGVALPAPGPAQYVVFSLP